MGISPTQRVEAGPEWTGCEDKILLHTPLVVGGGQCGTQERLTLWWASCPLPTKTSRAFSHFSDSSPFMETVFFYGVGAESTRGGYIWWCLVVYSIMYTWT